MTPLGLLSAGEKATIEKINASRNEAGTLADGRMARIEELGLRPGKTVEMLSNESGGPVLLKVDETRIALGRGLTMKVLVKRPGKGAVR